MESNIDLVTEWRNDPALFCRVMWPNEKIWEGQERLCRAVAKRDKVRVKAGHSVGKTHRVGRLVPWFLKCFEPSVVITTAPTFRQVNSQIWGEIRMAYKTAKYNFGGKLLETPLWKIADNHYAIGISTKDPDKIQGTHSLNVLIIIDEASGVPHTIYEAIEALRSSGSVVKVIELGNPLYPVGDFYNGFLKGDAELITLSCLDAVKAGIPGLVNQSWIDEQKKRYDEGSNPMYLPRVLGEFPKEAVDSVFSIEEVDKMFNQPNPVMGYESIKTTSSDPAFGGYDESIISSWVGYNQVDRKIMTKREAMETAGEIVSMHVTHSNNGLVLDEDGGGKVIGSRVRELGYGNSLQAIHSNSKEGIEEQYYNLRAAMWFNAKELARQGLVHLIPDDTTREQLLAVKYHRHSSGKILIDSKEDIKADFGFSPDRADDVVYALWEIKRRTMALPTQEETAGQLPWPFREATEPLTEGMALGMRNY